MSDTPQGPEWWQASDDKWYPPPRPAMPGEATTTYPTAPPTAPVTPGVPVGPYGAGGATPSPYGGVPSMPPGAGGPNRTALFATLSGLFAVAAVVLIIALASGGDDDDPQAGVTTTEDSPATTRDVDTTQPTATTDDPGPAPPGDVAAIEVVEEGWSTFNDAFDTSSGSYGFVIENTSDEAIAGAQLSVTVYDPNGGVVTTASGEIATLLPGERLGLGDDLYNTNIANGVGDIDVQVGESSFPLSVPTGGELSVTDIDWTGDDFGMEVTFNVASTYSEQIDAPGVGAVFRNAAGEIIGGTAGSMSNFIPANGNTGGAVSSIENVPDVSEVEIFVMPGAYYF